MRFAVFLFSVVWLPALALAQELTVPCRVRQMALAGDGSGIWFVCLPSSAAPEKHSDTAGQPTPQYARANTAQTEAYWLPTATHVPVKVANATASIYILAAPLGSQALVVTLPGSGRWRVALYDKQVRVKELPLDASFLLWSSESRRIYFYGGSTIQADVWDILGTCDLSTGTITRTQLHEPTEILRVCPANGEVYSVTPQYPNFAGSTVEYTSTIQFVRQIHGWIGALFSAHCTYVASEYSYHGPLPWNIYEVSTGKRMYHFSALDEEGKDDVYSPVQWNPKQDSILLREYLPAHNGPRILQVFDVRSGSVLQTLSHANVVSWSADGASIIAAEGNKLIWHSAKLPPYVR
jgi:hypothetical protein